MLRAAVTTEKFMKRYIRDHGFAPAFMVSVLLALIVFVARYGAALNPFDGCEFPEARSGPQEECRPVDWFWRNR